MRRMSFPNTPKRSPRTWHIAGGLAALVIVTAATTALVMRDAPTGAATPAPAAASTSAGATTGAPQAATTHEVVLADPAALDACELVAKAQGTDDLYDVAQMKAAGQRAAQSANTAVHEQGARLVGQAETAAAAKGKSGELQANLAMSTAATQFGTWCVEHKFTTG